MSLVKSGDGAAGRSQSSTSAPAFPPDSRDPQSHPQPPRSATDDDEFFSSIPLESIVAAHVSASPRHGDATTTQRSGDEPEATRPNSLQGARVNAGDGALSSSSASSSFNSSSGPLPSETSQMDTTKSAMSATTTTRSHAVSSLTGNIAFSPVRTTSATSSGTLLSSATPTESAAMKVEDPATAPVLPPLPSSSPVALDSGSPSSVINIKSSDGETKPHRLLEPVDEEGVHLQGDDDEEFADMYGEEDYTGQSDGDDGYDTKNENDKLLGQLFPETARRREREEEHRLWLQRFNPPGVPVPELPLEMLLKVTSFPGLPEASCVPHISCADSIVPRDGELLSLCCCLQRSCTSILPPFLLHLKCRHFLGD